MAGLEEHRHSVFGQIVADCQGCALLCVQKFWDERCRHLFHSKNISHNTLACTKRKPRLCTHLPEHFSFHLIWVIQRFALSHYRYVMTNASHSSHHLHPLFAAPWAVMPLENSPSTQSDSSYTLIKSPKTSPKACYSMTTVSVAAFPNFTIRIHFSS